MVVLPTCNIINHFRHKNGKFHGEPETHEHIVGKKLIFDTLQLLGVTPSIEARVGKRIADIFVKNHFIIEFQCSPISLREFKQRTDDYHEVEQSNHVFWIFGGKYFTHAKGRGERRIRKIEEFVLNAVGSPHANLYYCDGINFFAANWNFKCGRETLGWYNLHMHHLIKILFDNECAYREKTNDGGTRLVVLSN